MFPHQLRPESKHNKANYDRHNIEPSTIDCCGLAAILVLIWNLRFRWRCAG